MESATKTNDSWTMWVVVWPILTALIGSGITWWILDQQRQQDMSLRPPIVVMDVSEWVLKAGEGADDKARFKDGADKADAAAKKFESQGVMVLDKRIVRAAPKQVFVTTPEGSRAAAR